MLKKAFKKCRKHNRQLCTECVCVCSNSSSYVVVVVDLHFADQLGHQLLDGLRAKSTDLQDALVVHALRVLVALHHLPIDDTIS